MRISSRTPEDTLEQPDAESNTKTRRPATLPPGPRMPSALQALGWARRPLPFLERCRERYGDVFTLRIRHSGTWVILSDPEDLKKVLTADPSTLSVGMANTLLGPLLGARSVMLLEEPEHMARRRLMLPPFHGERMQGYSEMMAEITRREVVGWPADEPFELWPRMQAITLEAIMQAVFGPVETDQTQRLRKLLRELTEWLNNPHRLAVLPLLGPDWIARNTKFTAMRQAAGNAALEEIRDRRQNPKGVEGKDIATMLAHARYEDGSPMTDEDLRDELITLLTDGPTSSTLAWAFERLLRNPETLERLRAEIDADQDDSYLDAVVKETMRLRAPVALLARKLLEPMELGGYEIPPGTTVAPCVHLIHRREDIYPEPLAFDPGRFLDKPAGTYTWIPFGGGVRRCLAASYAQLLMKSVIRTVLSEVHLSSVAPGGEAIAKSAISFAPNEHALICATPRTSERARP